MSFIPQLIIDYDQLITHKYRFENYYSISDEEECKVLRYFYELIRDNEPFKFKDINLITCDPDLSYFNSIVRKWLEENKVEFGINN